MRMPLLLVGVVAAAVAPLILTAQDWSDRAEYDLALAVRAQSTAATRLPLLEDWKRKYPKSGLAAARAELTLDAAQSLGDQGKLLEAARELLAANPNHYGGLYWITVLAPSAAGATPSATALSEAESAAKRLAAAAPAFFASPAAQSTPAKQKTEVLALAHRTLGWAAWRRNDLASAEKELRAGLALVPRYGELSAWLGAILAVQKEPARQIAASWHLARASFLDGDGALAPGSGRRDVRALLEAVYSNYHGSLDGLDQIGAAASASATPEPPATFTIETAAEAAQRKTDEEMERTNPQLLTWVKIRRRLAAPDGDAQYAKLAESNLPLLKGYVIRCDQDPKPTEVVLGLLDSATEEVVLKFDAALPRCAEVGVAIEFEGKPLGVSRDPFKLTLAVTASALQGWPPPEATSNTKPGAK